ncbi:DinB family protein [Exiguobacterium flavidum]|uniref:DinB family protein n=1 Tax=Exiguobacterium flavidum TaxID=2184695 RepID=UPI000DF80B58|nr:DinB family protein [Exiguobacterium flavidum]
MDFKKAVTRHVRQGVETTHILFQIPNEEDWHKKVIDGKRTPYEIAKHLALLFEADLMIAKGATAEEMRRFYDQDVPIADLSDRMSASAVLFEEALRNGFETRQTYWGVHDTDAGWCIEMVGHFYHHRAQFFDQLVLLGHVIDFQLFE